MNINELAERLAEHAAPHLTERAIRAQIKELYPRRKRFTDDDYQEEQVRQRTARFLQLIFVGAANWKSQS